MEKTGLNVGAKIKELVDQNLNLDTKKLAAALDTTEWNIYRIYKKKTADTGFLRKMADILGVKFYRLVLTDTEIAELKRGSGSLSDLDKLTTDFSLIQRELQEIRQRSAHDRLVVDYIDSKVGSTGGRAFWMNREEAEAVFLDYLSEIEKTEPLPSLASDERLLALYKMGKLPNISPALKELFEKQKNKD